MLARALVNSALVAHDLPMPAEAPVAAAPQPAAPARTPNIDPGATTEIRLNLSDFE